MKPSHREQSDDLEKWERIEFEEPITKAYYRTRYVLDSGDLAPARCGGTYKRETGALTDAWRDIWKAIEK